MTELSFEKAMENLENIVEKLEKGGLSLNESLALFEKGVKMAKYLREELTKAEKRVEILLEDEKGEKTQQPFELSDEESKSKGKEKPSDNGEDEDLPF
ncbi:MAG: exodeoxyribonuclease VII small subunit [Candidatus Aminicenantaceae bacterium]